jgi:hypothetical protein
MTPRRRLRTFRLRRLQMPKTQSVKIPAIRVESQLVSAHSLCSRLALIRRSDANDMSIVRSYCLLHLSMNLRKRFRKIELRADDLYDMEQNHLGTIVLDDIFKLLRCDDDGLDAEEAHRRFECFGPNKLESEEHRAFLQVRGITLLQRIRARCLSVV